MFLLKIFAAWLLHGSLFIAKIFTQKALTSLVKISLEHSVQNPCLEDFDTLEWFFFDKYLNLNELDIPWFKS